MIFFICSFIVLRNCNLYVYKGIMMNELDLKKKLLLKTMQKDFDLAFETKALKNDELIKMLKYFVMKFESIR